MAAMVKGKTLDFAQVMQRVREVGISDQRDR